MPFLPSRAHLSKIIIPCNNYVNNYRTFSQINLSLTTKNIKCLGKNSTLDKKKVHFIAVLMSILYIFLFRNNLFSTYIAKFMICQLNEYVHHFYVRKISLLFKYGDIFCLH